MTCDGKRRTIPLTRSDIAENRAGAIYAVPQSTAETMLKAAECRLLLPAGEIALGRQQTSVSTQWIHDG